MKKIMITIMVIIFTCGSGLWAEEKKNGSGPLDSPEIASLADSIIKLQPRTTPFVAKFMAMHIINESKEKKLDPDLVAAQMWVESEFNPNATSKMGAVGLLQVRYQTWKTQPELKDNGVDAKHKLYWIDANIKCGTDILAKYLAEAQGNIAVALHRYYCGNPKLDKKPWETEYVSKILYYYFKIREHRLNGTPLEAEEIAAAPVPEPSSSTTKTVVVSDMKKK